MGHGPLPSSAVKDRVRPEHMSRTVLIQTVLIKNTPKQHRSPKLGVHFEQERGKIPQMSLHVQRSGKASTVPSDLTAASVLQQHRPGGGGFASRTFTSRTFALPTRSPHLAPRLSPCSVTGPGGGFHSPADATVLRPTGLGRVPRTRSPPQGAQIPLSPHTPY